VVSPGGVLQRVPSAHATVARTVASSGCLQWASRPEGPSVSAYPSGPIAGELPGKLPSQVVSRPSLLLRVLCLRGAVVHGV
jgi:hypothetical protein